MARRSAIPDWGMEYPEYVYRPWPKHVGFDKNGEQLVAHDQAEYDKLKCFAEFPKVIGKDRDGNDVVASDKRDAEFQMHRVVKTSVPETENALTDETPVKRGPGRPRSEAA